MKAENYIFIGFGILVGYVVYVNVTGKKDPTINYQSKPKFQSPLAE